MKLTCVDNFVEISKIVDPDSRQGALTDKYLEFLKDNMKIVKIFAYKNLGPFIETLQNLKVNDKLFEAYLHMTDYSINSLGKDNEVKFNY